MLEKCKNFHEFFSNFVEFFQEFQAFFNSNLNVKSLFPATMMKSVGQAFMQKLQAKTIDEAKMPNILGYHASLRYRDAFIFMQIYQNWHSQKPQNNNYFCIRILRLKYVTEL